jgi:hypothetical protein
MSPATASATGILVVGRSLADVARPIMKMTLSAKATNLLSLIA